ncbi:hypothetical protein BG015_011590 [Linnemannia schmuckeri]|uniref:Uncharacterized protein n=1 Tax=Linnemannia schmuckeri TaxID=64567 RepID=A0A9P5RSI7_9FUNG|nr:hypothetical protein BG015_011590 [Linnemannia schmuckeri]
MTTSISTRHRALLGVLLIFCIASLLALSLRPLSKDTHSDWVVSRRPGFSSSTPSDSNNSNPPSSTTSNSIDDAIGTGAKGSDPENHFGLDPYTIDYSKMTLRQLKSLIQGTLLDTSDDLLDPTRPIRPKGAPGTQSQLQLDELDSEDGQDDDENDGNSINNHDDDEEGGDEELDGGQMDSQSSPEYDGEEEDNNGSSPPPPPASAPAAPEDEVVDESISSEEEDTKHTDDSETEETQPQQDEPLDGEQVYLDEPAGEQEELELENEPLEGGHTAAVDDDNSSKPSLWDNTLQEFDVNKFLSPSDSYLVFVPSGETIEAQFFSLLTSLWIAKHSNRTLIIPPPMMAPPSLYHLYPLFAGNKGRKRQRWSTLFDLRFISNLQRTVLIDTTRPVLQTPFTAEMAREEENPTSATQSVPYRAPVTNDEDDDVTVTPAGSTVPVKIKCHGPPTAGSWKALDFAGRHFLNRYNLVAEFEILEDPYWSLKPEAISRHWRATTSKTNKGGPGSEDRHRQFICISGAELVGSENAAIEEMIWQEIGLQIPFSNAVKGQGRQSVTQVLRAVEKIDKSNGYIGVHIDKLPSREFCRPGGPRYETSDSTVAPPQGQDQGSQQQHQKEEGARGDRKDEVNGNVVAAAAGNPSMTSTTSTSMIPSQCLWTVDLIAKRIALLQQTESNGVGTSRPPRPVIVTTTETDPELLSKMDQQTGWFRVGDEDEGNGLFDTTVEDLGGYGPAAVRTFIMSNSAVFVGNRASALATHAAFRIKNEGRVKQLPPRWELY